jgi:hypothetical protein
MRSGERILVLGFTSTNLKGNQAMNLTAKMLVTSACAVAAFATGVALAGDANPAPAKAANALDDMKVARDRETGELRNLTQEEEAALKVRTKGASYAPNVVVVRRPSTTVEIRADGSVVAKRSLEDLDNIVATRSADGKTVLRHSDKPEPASPTHNLPRE